MRSQNEASAFASKELANRFDLLRGCFLFGDHVIETKNHQRIRVRQHALVERLSLSGLIDSLVNRHRTTGSLLHHALEFQQREMEQLQRSGNALQEHFFGEL